MVVDTACGNPPDLSQGAHYGASAIRFIYNEADLAILERIRSSCPDWLKFVSDISMGSPDDIQDSSSRFGYFIVACESAEEAKRILKL